MDSDMPHPDPTANAYPMSSVRSDRSREFEIYWRGLPRDGLIPHRRDVKPARVA
jgi:hypothetical protein